MRSTPPHGWEVYEGHAAFTNKPCWHYGRLPRGKYPYSGTLEMDVYWTRRHALKGLRAHLRVCDEWGWWPKTRIPFSLKQRAADCRRYGIVNGA